MEFILNNKKYSIVNYELFIDYLIVDSYFRQNYSKYDYDIEFDFVTPALNKDKITSEDILKGTERLEELIEKEELNFINPAFQIDEHVNGNFKITYQDIELSNLKVGQAVPVLIALDALLKYKPILTLDQIKEEITFFIERYDSYDK